MGERTRDEHMAWCKARALAYLPADPAQAFASFASDIDKHPETATLRDYVAMHILVPGFLEDPRRMREWIEGFA